MAQAVQACEGISLMFKITDSNGKAHYVAAENVARVTEADMSSRYHGTRSFVRMFDGAVIECLQDAHDVAQWVDSDRLKSQQAIKQ